MIAGAGVLAFCLFYCVLFRVMGPSFFENVIVEEEMTFLTGEEAEQFKKEMEERRQRDTRTINQVKWDIINGKYLPGGEYYED